MKILIIDDDKSIRMALRMRLERRGHTIHEYDRSDGALELAERLEPDLTITDHNLGKGDKGLKIASALIGNNKRAVLMSCDPTVERPSWDMGVPFIFKPNMEGMFAMIEEVEKKNKKTID